MMSRFPTEGWGRIGEESINKLERRLFSGRFPLRDGAGDRMRAVFTSALAI
jgi:hypothetical protein